MIKFYSLFYLKLDRWSMKFVYYYVWWTMRLFGYLINLPGQWDSDRIASIIGFVHYFFETKIEWAYVSRRLYIFFSSSIATRTIIFYLWKHINEDWTRFNTSVNYVNLSPTKDKDVIRWIIEVKNLSKQYPGKPECNDQYSITKKSYKGEILLESQAIIVNKKNLLQLRDKIDTLLNECM